MCIGKRSKVIYLTSITWECLRNLPSYTHVKNIYIYINSLLLRVSCSSTDECMSTKLGVTENFVSSLYLLIQRSTLKKCIEHCLTALTSLLCIYIYIYDALYLIPENIHTPGEVEGLKGKIIYKAKYNPKLEFPKGRVTLEKIHPMQNADREGGEGVRNFLGISLRT